MDVPPGDGRESEPEREPDEPLVLLPEDESGGLGRWGPVRWILSAVLVGAVAAAAGLFLLGGGGGGGSDSGGPVRPPPRPRTSAAVSHLDTLTGTLQQRLSGYWEAQDAFDRKRIGCDSLAAVYRHVDDAFLSVAEAYRQASARAGGPASSTFDRASTAADSANRRFDATGCRRPQ